ncbi:glycoside hydrolase family 19 protein [Dechloromonas hortensis]|uniref:glycoside hydrolase family 19 protein n=1 Tax=Dechloromonas hortensis TaxID=337779 RepID=UPI001290EBD1|nr:glycoside hydrolase family 19 protein [Dechloromonas hortensis]
MQISEQVIRNALPLCRDPAGWAPVLSAAMQRYEINTPARIASFLAQTGHESGQFNRLVESLYYTTPQRLMKVWPKRFPSEAIAAPYVKNEERLANYVYANRLGNGDARSGDGYKYRGRGLIQVTGRSNYAACAKALDLDLLNDPGLLIQPQYAALSAAWFWNSRGLNALADDRTGDDDLEDFTVITRSINGGTQGLKERLALLNALERQLA